jgi:hypothetical protein
MSPKSLPGKPMDQLRARGTNPATDWLWHGYLARGNITLLTSVWKAGKTTLLSGLLRQLATGGEFLGQACQSARAWVISEESEEHWDDRLRLMPVGPHARLIARPFLTRPTPAAWAELIDQTIDARADGEADLFVVDPLGSFVPGRYETDAGTVLDFLSPLQRLSDAGAAVLLLHHPRRERSEEGSTARGGGALLGFVDIILEVHRYGRLQSEQRRRRLVGLSRKRETPAALVYEWDSGTGGFTRVDDPHEQRYRDNWEQVRALLAARTSAATHHELVADWPGDRESPSATVLYEWLNRAFTEKLIRRGGTGRKTDPYRYRLENEDDAYYDRGELPPLRDILPPASAEEVYREAEEVLRRLGPEKPRRRKGGKAKAGKK